MFVAIVVEKVDSKFDVDLLSTEDEGWEFVRSTITKYCLRFDATLSTNLSFDEIVRHYKEKVDGLDTDLVWTVVELLVTL